MNFREVTNMPTKKETVCEVCGKTLKGGNPAFHIRSKFHQAALAAQNGTAPPPKPAPVVTPPKVVETPKVPIIETTPTPTPQPKPVPVVKRTVQPAPKVDKPPAQTMIENDDDEFDGWIY